MGYKCVARVAEHCAAACADASWPHCVAVAALAGLLYHVEVQCAKLGRRGIPAAALGFTHWGFKARKLWPAAVFPELEDFRSSGLSVAMLIARGRGLSKYPWIELLRRGRDFGVVESELAQTVIRDICVSQP